VRDKRICIVATASLCIKTLYQGQIKYLVDMGAKVTFVSDVGEEHDLVIKEGGESVQIPIARKPSIFKDLLSLWRLFFFFLFNRFDLVIVSTPKASLLGSIAARLAMQKKLLFIVRGRAYEQFVGRKRILFEIFDRLVCFLATRVQFISREMMGEYVYGGFCKKNKAYIIGCGSSKGVNFERFRPDILTEQERSAKRSSLSIPSDATVFTFCGRVRRDKGIAELVRAFRKLLSEAPNSNFYLLIIGPDELHLDCIDGDVVKLIENEKNIIRLDWVDAIEEFFAISDIFVFPSYREGFGNAAIEASASGLPVIAFDVTGCRESVQHNVSGYLCPFGDVAALAEKMGDLAKDIEKRLLISDSGFRWARGNFDQKVLLKKNVEKYAAIIDGF
jgi:glycosyltransferase involved in cell wall biosynthesis